MTKKKLRQCFCPGCMTEDEIVCTATESNLSVGAWHCNRGALTLEEAQERKKQRELMWESYLKSKKSRRFVRENPPTFLG